MKYLPLAVIVLALLATGSVAAQAAAPDPAVPSARAASTLLLAVARAGPRLVAVGHRGHVVLSEDSGETWRQATSVPTRATLTAVYFIDEQRGWITGHDAAILHTTDGGDTWKIQHMAAELETPLFSLWFEDARHGLAVGAYGLALRTRDGGAHWKRFSLAADEDPHLYRLFETPNGTLLVAAERGTIYRSTDRGDTWEARHTDSPGSFWGGLALRSGTLLAFGIRGHLYRSDDDGEHWAAAESGTRQSLTAGIELDDGRVVITGLGGTLLHSHDGGGSFRVDTRDELRVYSAVSAAAGDGLILFGEAGAERVGDENGSADP